MKDQYIFEEIKKKYKNSNKYVLNLTYEDIGILINLVNEEKEKNKELKTIIEAYNIIPNKYIPNNMKVVIADMEYFKYGILKETMISKSKIKVKIEELKKENEQNRKDLERSINFFNFNKIREKIFINICIKDTLQSLLEEDYND